MGRSPPKPTFPTPPHAIPASLVAVELTSTATARFMTNVKFGHDNECWLWSGCVSPDGYGRVRISGHTYLSHRVSFTIFNGCIPGGLSIDHICHNRRCVNPNHLRLCDDSENRCNSSIRSDNCSGFKGVSWDSRLQKWRARIAFKGSNISLGVFNRADLAADAYRAKAKELHGEFAFFGDH